MSDAKNHALVVAIFGDKAAADTAMHDLQQWEKAPEGIKLGGLCVIAKSQDGHVEFHRAHVLDVKKGLEIGLIAGAVIGGVVAFPLGAGLAAAAAVGGAGIAATGATIGAAPAAYAAATGIASGVVGAAGAGAAGGVIGAVTCEVSTALWGFKREDLALISAHLDAGKAALLVLSPEAEAEATGAELARLGGSVEQYHLPGEAVDQAKAALAAGGPHPPAPSPAGAGEGEH
ncbi:MAG: hypothetical protein AB7N70_20755 [Dehalococcoidia bacterium]